MQEQLTYRQQYNVAGFRKTWRNAVIESTKQSTRFQGNLVNNFLKMDVNLNKMTKLNLSF